MEKNNQNKYSKYQKIAFFQGIILLKSQYAKKGIKKIHRKKG